MHDRNGTPIQKGDKVLIEAVVDEVYAGADYCNVRLAIGSDKPHGPANIQSSVTLNSHQTLLLERPLL